MLLFCPTCANSLRIEEGSNSLRYFCSSCPYIYNITEKFSRRLYTKPKARAEAWANVDSTEETCPKCSNSRAFFMQIQTRSADEPMTTFYKCCNPKCNHRWRE
ncbi:hypothetical protein J437_LFUL011471 [Ladona fulva]|uniref:DNA-directed RNA polymerase subunit n=1 Tax=Ladona fulva TaxID=123851 RepID=A0A8K0KDC5_LADFU|nr:hypothetical protein J437_LFUL011471 [Ladona fulva]